MAVVERTAPPRGDATLYMRDVDRRVASEAKVIAGGREWTLAQLLAQLLELRRGCLAITAEYAPAIADPVRELLEHLELDPREV